MKDSLIETENYKNNIKNSIKMLINEEKLEEANAFIENYDKIIKNDLDIISMKAIIMLKENKLIDAENLLEQALNSEIYLRRNKKRILIGSPIHQKPNILKEFMYSLEKLNDKDVEIDYLFIDDNDIEESHNILKEFSLHNKNVTIYKSDSSSDYKRDERTHYWNEELMWRVADLKDSIIKVAIEADYDYLFLIDSDLIIHPETLNQLIAAKTDIISNIFWTKWNNDSECELPQVWLYDQYTQYYMLRSEAISNDEIIKRKEQFINSLKRPGVYKIGGLGACTLISRRALRAGVNFKEIKNLSFIGEDRHFCVRAQALGFDLYVDTHYPAYHIYRESDLNGVDEYKKKYNIYKIDYANIVRIAKKEHNKITLSMVLGNEAGNYLRNMLEETRKYIDNAVIIDDASTDSSIEIVREVLSEIPVKIIRNEESKFSNEVLLRKQQWEETINTKPDWILFLDADQIFEKKFAKEVSMLINQIEADVYCFRLYDFWDKDKYRDDEFWSAHNTYRPYLLRYQENFNYMWKETAQHCGSFPMNVLDLPYALSELRLKHYGWAKEEDRIAKYERYMKLDSEGKYGIKKQYESILDNNPNLILWEE